MNIKRKKRAAGAGGLRAVFGLLLCAVLLLSNCASIMEYWSFDEEGNPIVPPDPAAVEQAVLQAVTPPDESRNPEPSPAAPGQQNPEQTETDTPLQEGAVPQENDADTDIQALRNEAAAAQAAQKQAEEDLAAAQQRIAELESSSVPANLTAGETEAAAVSLAEMQRQFAEAEAARKKAEADLAAAQKKAADEAAAAQKKAAADLAAAQKKAADEAAAAQKKAAADLTAAQKKAADDAAAAQKKAAADLTAAQKKAADAEAARQKAEAEAAAARKQAEELNAQMTSRAAEQLPPMQGVVIQNVSMAITPSQALAVQAAPPQSEPVVAAQTPTEDDGIQRAASVVQVASPEPEPVVLAQTPAENGDIPSAAPVSTALRQPVSPQNAKYYTIARWPPDCLWEIAGWVYGNPYRWPVLYEANRSKLPDPDNPDLLEPGTVLEIPSINGEIREGEYIR